MSGALIGLLILYAYIAVNTAGCLILRWRRDRPRTWREFLL